MKIFWIYAVTVGCGFLGLKAKAEPFSCSRPLTVGWEQWEPYQYKDKDGKINGLDNELLNLIIADMGSSCSIKAVEMPWKRHLEELKAGSIDVALAASITDERKAFAIFSLPYRPETMSLYVLSKDMQALADLTSIDDFKNKKFALEAFKKSNAAKDPRFVLGVLRGYFYGDKIKALAESKEYKSFIQEVKEDEQNVEKLKAGKINGYLADPVVANKYIKDHHLEKEIVKHPLAINADDVYVMFSKKSVEQKLLDKFNESLKKVKEGQAYQAVLKKYLD